MKKAAPVSGAAFFAVCRLAAPYFGTTGVQYCC